VGLLFADNSSVGDFSTKSEAAWLQGLGCKACPLDSTPGKIDASGSSNPTIYVLGDSPGKAEQDARKHFVGNAADLLRSLMPKKALPLIRWNDVINCYIPGAGVRKPNATMLTCCKPRIVTDIERTKPKVIWGFGEAPLKWVSGFSGIDLWRGRRMPVKIGNHTCWYYPFIHPLELSRIAKDTRFEFGSEDERMTCYDLERAFADLGNLPKPVVHTPEIARENVECITDVGQIQKALQWASRQSAIGYDYETNRKRPYAEGAKILSLGIGTLERAFAFPLRHPEAPYTKKQLAEVEDLVARFLISAPCTKYVHNLVFEMEWTGVFFGRKTLRARSWLDTVNAAACIDERTKKVRNGPLSLVFLVQQYFGFNLKNLSDLDKAELEFTPLSQVLPYNGMDSKYHFGLGEKLLEIIEEEGLELPHELMQRRVPTVTLSQLKGVPVNQVVSRKLQKKYQVKLDDVLDAIAELPIVQKFERQRGKPLNTGSPQDLVYVFNDMLECREVAREDKYAKKIKYSTDEDALKEVIKNHKGDAKELAELLIEFREISGTKSKYIDSLIQSEEACVVYPDNMVHTNFNTALARTGRLSSDDPNLQNFPYRNAETREVRRAMEARLGRIGMKFDYGQIEARVIAMYTRDKTFVKALWENFDIHGDWAERLAYAYPSRVGGKKFLTDKKVMKDFRTDIKTQWTFPLVYGARDTSVAHYLEIPVDIISKQIREFWKIFPTARDWQESQIRFYREYGYVETLNGRRRNGPLTTNQILNSGVQGTAAEIVLDAMSRLSETEDPELQPEINIHDDLTFLDIDVKRSDIVAEKIIDAMINVPFKFVNVPIVVEMGVGKNWCDLEELKDENGKSVSVYSSDTWKK
jgi:DNA polymerase I